MKHSILVLIIFLTVGIWVPHINAQGASTLVAGDPPNASLISISPADENGIVTISGASNSVYPAAQLSVLNLYTEEVAYVQAGITGTFSISLFGPGNTPFLISPTSSIPADRRNIPGVLPGGPATIVYGAFPDRARIPQTSITQLLVDGVVNDWQAYPQSNLETGLQALRNQNSIYIAIPRLEIDNYTRMELTLRVDNAVYAITLDPRVYVTAVWQEIEVLPIRELGTLAVTAAIDEQIELRIPLDPIRNRLLIPEVSVVVLDAVAFLDADANVLELREFSDENNIPTVDEQDGIVYRDSLLDDRVTRFSVSGPVAQGAAFWHARTRLNQLMFQPDDNVIIEMDVNLNAPALGETLVGLEMIGRVGLLPVAIGDALQPTSTGLLMNNGWSTLKTNSGLAIDNLHSAIYLGEMRVPPPQVIRSDDTLLFGFAGNFPIPDDLPAGMYVPFFEGYGQVGNGEVFRWVDNGLLGEGDGISRVPVTRFPVPLRIGIDDEQSTRMLWTLFQDNPSDGSRGILAIEDRDIASLSNRIRFDSPTYILPPSNAFNGDIILYSLEPYLLNMLPNLYDTTAAPLLPLLFPSGRLNLVVNRPDGVVDNMGGNPILQNKLSSAALDERFRFGEQSQVDVYQLTTLNKSLTDYEFDQYGDYVIELNGLLEDIWGNRYNGGGTYPFVVAEQLDMSPSVLPGTPFEVGDNVNIGLHITPAVAADVTVRLQLFPLDGSEPVDQVITGVANPYGVFQSNSVFAVQKQGEYIIDYEARYIDGEERLWAGSLRSAGVVGSLNENIIAHGQRGLENFDGDYDPAWFLTERYADIPDEQAQLYPPYNTGDIVWFADRRNAGIYPQLRLQDTTDDYVSWLNQTYPDLVDVNDIGLAALVSQDALPNELYAESPDTIAPLLTDRIANNGYSYFSFVNPTVTLRQFVLGSEQPVLPLLFDANDPLNEQIGAGSRGLRPDDYFFMFGGAILENESANVEAASIYASLGVVISEDSNPGSRVFPPYRGAAGGPDGGALLTLDDKPIDMFFHPTGVRPGDVLQVGDTLSISGQVAPTLKTNVDIKVITPSGVVRQVTGTTNGIGYFYEPEFDRAVNEIGVWTVEIAIMHDSVSSAGEAEPPFPTGDVLGSTNGRFHVYVVNADNEKLPWSQNNDNDIEVSAGFPFNLTFSVPEGWTETNGYITAIFPQVIIEDRDVNLQGSSLAYQFNPSVLNQTYSFYEGNDGRLKGGASSDPLQLTFVISGFNENGEFDVVARQVLIRHDRLTSLD